MNRFSENLSFSSLLLNPVVSETLKVIDSAHSKNFLYLHKKVVKKMKKWKNAR
jgi:hypothetical protein